MTRMALFHFTNFRQVRLALILACTAALLILLSYKVGAAQASLTPTLAEERHYQNCLSLAAREPDAAFETALAWEDSGGGVAAQHCGAVALNALGHFSEAAERFENIAAQMPEDSEPALVAEIMAQAGLSWQQADEVDRAYDVQSKALEIAPGSPDILVDRATSLFARNNYWEALDDLNVALDIRPNDPTTLIYRASAYRHVDAPELGLVDADRALRLQPDHPEGLLERGILRRLTDDLDGARLDWLTLIRLHEGRPAADAARRNLELLDVKTHK